MEYIKVDWIDDKKITTKQAKKKAWEVFSKYIRLRGLTRGEYGPCYTCGKMTHYKNLQAGHWIEGHSNMVYINEDYVRPQCKGCNMFKGGAQGDFRDRLRKEMGDKWVDAMIIQSKQILKLNKHDYLELEQKYKYLIEELK